MKDFWAIYQNNVVEDMQFLFAFGVDVHRKIEKFALILASTLTFNLGCLLGCSRFPYKENIVNKWFFKKFSSEDGLRQKTVRIINVDEQGREMNIYGIEADNFPTSDDRFEVFFHGTNRKSAEAIIEENIDVTIGDEALDFSDGGGFYVSDRFDNSLQWARDERYKGESIAVLIFRVDKMQLRGPTGEITGLDLRDLRRNLRLWHQVIELYRKSNAKSHSKDRRQRKEDTELRKQLKPYDFIEGPTTFSRERLGGNLLPDNETYQLCVRTDKCAELFDQSLWSAVFFE